MKILNKLDTMIDLDQLLTTPIDLVIIRYYLSEKAGGALKKHNHPHRFELSRFARTVSGVCAGLRLTRSGRDSRTVQLLGLSGAKAAVSSRAALKENLKFKI